MMKIKTDWQQDVIPGYDPVQCKREAHAMIREETKGMTDKEVRAYFRRNVEKDERWREAYAKADAIAADK
jgi:hypothetical protein